MTSAHASSWGPQSAGVAYELGRPSYPPGLAALIAREAGTAPSSTLVDLAAGTGKLTRVLAAGSGHVIAVEPMPGMRAQLHQTTPDVALLAGAAEQLPFRSGALDVVTVAQAFHWFRVAEASPELHRVLAPSGKLILVTNTRSTDHQLSVRLWEVLAGFEHLAPRPESAHHWRSELDRLGHFGDWRHFELPYEQILANPEELEARFTSVSFVLLLDEADRSRLTTRLHEVAGDDYPIRLPLHTLVTIGDRLAPGA